MIEIDQLLFRWQQGQTISQLSRSLGQSRQTVRKYLRLAENHGLNRDGDEAQRAQVLAAVCAVGSKPPSQSSPAQRQLAPHQEQIRDWLQEPDMTMKQVWRLLRERGVKLSYPSVKRFIRSTLEPAKRRVTGGSRRRQGSRPGWISAAPGCVSARRCDNCGCSC